MTFQERTDFLNEKVAQYNHPDFIETDPIQIPHSFSKKEDIEISGFLASTIAWGNRKMIINNAQKIMNCMDHAPHDFIINHTSKDLAVFEGFVHRTFNATDLQFFVQSLQNIYLNHQGLEALFQPKEEESTMKEAFSRFHRVFFEPDHLQRTEKHISNASKGSACKRLIMFLRWMVRQDHGGVDFGIWKRIPAAKLTIPLDVHSGKTARALGLIQRKANDWKTLEEIDIPLRKMDAQDPAKYDFALFGLSVFEEF